jgi:hypothetical protein
MSKTQQTIPVRQIEQAGPEFFKISLGISFKELSTQRSTGNCALALIPVIRVHRQSNLLPDSRIYR